MQRVNEYRFVELGAALERLKDLEEDTLFFDALFPCLEARRTLTALLTDPVSLRVCLPAVRTLINAVANVLPTPERRLDANAEIGDANARQITSGVTELSTVLAAECRTLDTYAVSPKGAYSMSTLINQAEDLIPESARRRLHGTAIHDIQQAGRCLAFDLPTAAGFHLFRAVESVMRVLYSTVKANLPAHDEPNTWFHYVEKLKEAEVASNVTDLLNSIRQNYRNPLAHPDATLTIDDAIVLVPLGVMAIQKMVEVMPKTGDLQDSPLARLLAGPPPATPQG